jgi:chitodextrinase
MHKPISVVVLALAVLGISLWTVDAQARAHHHGRAHHRHHHAHYRGRVRHHAHHRHRAAHKSRRGRFSRAKGSDAQPPTAPSNLTASAGNQQISLGWNASVDNVAVGGYRIFRNGHRLTTVGASTLSYTNTGLTNGTSYSYYVVAYDTSGNVSPASNTVSATPTSPSAEPVVAQVTSTSTEPSTTTTESTLPLVSTAGLALYEPTSAWNTAVGSSPVVDPLSGTYINAIANNGLPLTSDPDEYTIPVYTWSSSTPTFTVTGSGYFHSYDAGNDTTSVGHGSPWTVSGVPIPAGASGGVGSDGQIVLLNPETGVEYEFWQFYQASDGSYHATNGAESHTTSGYYGRFGDGLAGRGDGTPYLAGLVRRWEVEQGHIDHAIAFAYNSPSSAFVYPASKSDGGNFGGVLGTDAPEGTRIQLDPSLTEADFEAWGLSPMARIIAHALQQYGMIVVDHSGSSKIYLEDRTTAGWESTVTRNLVSAIPWSAFRVVDVPAGPA